MYTRVWGGGMAPWGLAQGNRSVCVNGAGQGPMGASLSLLAGCWLQWRRGAGLCNHPRAPAVPPRAHAAQCLSSAPTSPAALLVTDLCV